MMTADYKSMMNDLIALVGPREARRLLVIEGLSPSTADHLCRGSYPTIGDHVGLTIKRVLAALRRPAS